MTTQAIAALIQECSKGRGEGLHTEAERELHVLRRVEQEQAEKIRQLEDMLRLANDKMAEQVRQARVGLLEDVMGRAPTVPSVERLAQFWEWLTKVHDANAPKD